MMYWTRDRVAAMLPILTAFAEGKTVEFGREGGDWTACESLGFNSEPNRYRVRPAEPVCDGNWKMNATAHQFIERGSKAFRVGSGNWLCSGGPGCENPKIQYYDCLSRIDYGQAVEVNDTTKQIRAAQPAVSVANRDEFDDVNHPKHYTSDPSNYECIQFAEHMTMCLGNATKYLWREGLKGDAIEQLQKSVRYLRNHLKIDQASAATLNIHKVINGRAWPIAEAMRLIWKVSQRRSPNERGDILEAIEILEAEIDRRKEAAK